MAETKNYPDGIVQQTDEFKKRQEIKNLVGELIEKTAKEEIKKAFKKLGFDEKDGYYSVIANDEDGKQREVGKGTAEGKVNVTISKPKNLNPDASKPISYMQKVVTFGGKKLVSEIYLEIVGENLQISYKNTEDSGFQQQSDGPTYAARELEKKATLPISDTKEFKKKVKDMFESISEAEAEYLTQTKIAVDNKTEKNMNASIVKENKFNMTLKDLMEGDFQEIGSKIQNMVNESMVEKERKSDTHGTPDTSDGNPTVKLGDKELLFGQEKECTEQPVQEIVGASAESNKAGQELMGATQNGEPKLSGYFFVRFEDGKNTAVVKNKDGELERYGKSPNFAGYHLIIGGADYEFMSSESKEEEKITEMTTSGPGIGGPTEPSSFKYAAPGWAKDGKTPDLKASRDLGYTPVNEEIQKTAYGENKVKRSVIIRNNDGSFLLEDINKSQSKEPYTQNVEMEPGHLNTPKGMTKPYTMGMHGKADVNSKEELNLTGHGDLNAITNDKKMTKRKFVTNEENEKAGINKRYIITDKYTKEELSERWKQLIDKKSFDSIQDGLDESILGTHGFASPLAQTTISREEGEKEMEAGYSDLNPSIEVNDTPACGCEDGMQLVPKGTNALIVFKLSEADIKSNKAYVVDHFTNKLVVNPLFKKTI